MSGIDGYTKLCCHFNSDYTDSSAGAHTLTAVGSPTISMAVKKWGAGSLSLPGSAYLYAADSADWDLPGDFAIDTWIRFNSLSDNPVPFIMQGAKNGTTGWGLTYYSGLGIRFNANPSTTTVIIWAWTPFLNTWYWFAMARSGNNWRAYVDGTQIGSTVVNAVSIPVSADTLKIGWNPSWTLGNWYIEDHYLDVYLDELRLSVETDRGWTGGTISVPTGEYTTDRFPYQTLAAAARRVAARAYSFPRADREALGATPQEAALEAPREALGVAPVASGIVAEREALGVAPVEAAIALDRDALGRVNIQARTLRRGIAGQIAAAIFGRNAKARTETRAIFDRKAAEHLAQSFAAERKAHVRPGYHVYDVTTDENYLGFIAEGATTLPGLAFPPGVYTLEVRTSRFFWESARTTRRFKIEIHAAAVPEVWEIPRIVNLAASIDGRARRVLSWDLDTASAAYRFDMLGIWFGASSPVTITGAPAYQVTPTAATAYSLAYRQTAPQWAAVAALDGATRGPSSELYLPWDTAAPVPPGQLLVETED